MNGENHYIMAIQRAIWVFVSPEMGQKQLHRAAGFHLMLFPGHCWGASAYTAGVLRVGHVAACGQESVWDLKGPGDVQENGNKQVMQYG